MSIVSFFTELCNKLGPIVFAIGDVGGTPYLVGGCVRDLVLGCGGKDIDIEVHGLTVEQLLEVLKSFGHVREVGKKFGVLRIDGIDADWSLPRRDSKGRKPVVEIDPHMSIEAACRRRDLTMNAMAIDLHEVCCRYKNVGQAPQAPLRELERVTIIDPYGGLKDIAAKQLNAIDPELFVEDPLRFFRVMQFIGRFEMQPSAALNTLCSHMKLWDEQSNCPISKERIFEEIKKLFLKSVRPSLGLRWLQDIGRLKEIFPEVHALVGVPQRPDYHPEGDAFEHTMQALDAAANLNYELEREIINVGPGFAKASPGSSVFPPHPPEGILVADEKFLIMLALLAHDLGKASTTDIQLHCKGHEEAGVPLAENLLRRITDNSFLIAAVKKLVKYHCAPVGLTADNVSIKAYKRLALKLAPEVTLRHIGLVGMADILGRNRETSRPLEKPVLSEHIKRIELFLSRAQEANVTYGPEKPVLLGRHLLDIVAPGAELGVLLDKAYHIQIEEGIQDWQELKKRVLADRF